MNRDDDDDILIGRMWTRKEVMRLLGATALLAGCGSGGTDTGAVQTATTTPTASPTATPLPATSPTPMTPIVSPSATPVPSPVPNGVFTPALTEGPYFVDERILRSDVRGDRVGRELRLALRVQQVVGSVVSPYVGAQVDIWQTDANGVYSDIASEGTSGQNWMRGYQITDNDGRVNFTTLYPGWYRGRTIHIHVKIRKDNYLINTQLFFDDTFSDTIMSQPPYNTRGNRDTRNANDGIYNQDQGGSKLTLVVTDSGGVLAAPYTFGLAM